MVVYPYNRMILKDENEWNTDTLCNMNESQKLYAKWKKSNIIKPTYCMILFMWHSREDHSRVIKKADQWFLGARREGKKLTAKRAGGTFWCDGNDLYLDFININTLVLILHYNFPMCHHWGQLSKAYMRSFFIISYNWMWIYNHLKVKNEF